MKTLNFKIILLVLSTALFFSYSAIAADRDELFTNIIMLDGTDIELSTDKWTVVMIWVTTCRVCKTEKPIMSSFHKKHVNGNIEVFGISVDGLDNISNAREYILNHNIEFPNGIGDLKIVRENILQLTGELLLGTPTYILFNPDGKILAVQAGRLPPKTIEDFVKSRS